MIWSPAAEAIRRRAMDSSWHGSMTDLADIVNRETGAAVTKSAVIGKLHRLGLPGDGRIQEIRAARSTEARLADAIRRREREAQKMVRVARGETQRPHRPRVQLRLVPVVEIDLTSAEAFPPSRESACRSIVCDDPLTAVPVLCCGARSIPGSSYCAGHHAICHTTPARRRAA